MTNDVMQQKIESMELTLAEVQQKLAALESARTKPKWWDKVGRELTPEESATFDEAAAYGRYWRVTGELPPDDWKPGDPIPEPNWDEME